MIQKIINFFLSLFCALHLRLFRKKEIKQTEIFLGYEHSQEELEVLRLINKHRLTLKLRQLYTNSYLSYKCEEHNTEMVAEDLLSHNGFSQRVEDITTYLKCEKVAENVGYGYKSAQGIFNAWLKSERHKENIEGDFMEFGVSARKNLTGNVYWTNIFIK